MCLVEGCDKVCWTWSRRRLHVIDKHHFPRDYDFSVINDGIDNKTSTLQNAELGLPYELSSKRADWVTKESQEDEQTVSAEGRSPSQHTLKPDQEDKSHLEPSHAPDKDLTTRDRYESLVDSMASLKFIPNSVRLRKQPSG